MSPIETRAVITLSVLATFADGEKHERQRAQIKQVADGFSQEDAVHLSTLYQDVLMKRATLPGVVVQLESAEAKQLGYEMAVCVCDADGVQSDAEQRFLAELRTALGLDTVASAAFTDDVQSLAALPLTARQAQGAAAALESAVVNDAELDGVILNAAIVNGALELLPEMLSTMAIIPLQMKLVYRIGKAHGFELDTGHVKDFLATAGVGLTSQYLEQAGRKLLGGVLGTLGGGMLGGVGKGSVAISVGG